MAPFDKALEEWDDFVARHFDAAKRAEFKPDRREMAAVQSMFRELHERLRRLERKEERE